LSFLTFLVFYVSRRVCRYSTVSVSLLSPALSSVSRNFFLVCIVTMYFIFLLSTPKNARHTYYQNFILRKNTYSFVYTSIIFSVFYSSTIMKLQNTNIMNFITEESRTTKFPEYNVGVSKHVAVLTICTMLLIYIYIYTIYVCNLCGVDNELHKMHGTYIKIHRFYR
jgi:hypothetical protein